ncbi:MAG: sugar phosphate isomerase/epimerase family protein [Pirellula sp.]|jgi:inosose dehydratase
MFSQSSQTSSSHRGSSRREFLAGVAATACAAGLSMNPVARLIAQEAKAAGLKLGLQIYSLRGFPVDVALDHTKNLGFEQVEFFSGMFPLDASDDDIKKMVNKVKGLGLTISAHGVNGFTKDAAANRRVFEFAKKAGIKNISAAPTPDSMDSLEELVKEYDIRIAIHNHGPSDRFNKVVDLLRAVEGRDVRIGACADLGHYIRSGEKPVDVIRSLAGRLYGIHLKDFAEMKENTRGVLLGQGHLNCEAVFDALIQAKFPADGALSLEYEENPQDPTEDIRKCVATARAALAKVRA